MTICACALIGSAVVMLGAFLLAGNFGVRQLVCSLIGSGAAVVFGICLLWVKGQNVCPESRIFTD